MVGRVLSLHTSAERDLPRPLVKSVNLIAGHGVEGDRKAGKRPDRQVLLVGVQTYEHLTAHGFSLPFGALGENMVLDFEVMGLEAGTRLEIGEAILEISLRCSPCAHLYQTWPGIQELLSGTRGMLARVLRGGTVRTGDPVAVIGATW